MALILSNKPTKSYLQTAAEYAHTLYGVGKHLWSHKDNLISIGSSIMPYIGSAGSLVSSSSKSKSSGRIRTGGGKSSSSIYNSTVPVAQNTTIHNTTFWHEQSLPKHVEFGESIRITGRQVFCDFVTTGTGSELMSGGAAVGNNAAMLSPDVIGSRLALIARTYDKYAFRYVKLYYFPRIATTQAGGFAMSYIQDGAIDSYVTLDYSAIQQVDPCVVAPFRETASLEMVYQGNNAWFCEVDTTGIAEKRFTRQGFISAYPDASSIGAMTMGHVIIEYVCDLYQPIADLGFTVSLKSVEERDFIMKQLSVFRSKNPPPPRLTYNDFILELLKNKSTPSK